MVLKLENLVAVVRKKVLMKLHGSDFSKLGKKFTTLLAIFRRDCEIF